MPATFAYETREKCVCGSLLDANRSKRTVRHFNRGTVTFVQCLRCSSWCQSPRITLDSQKDWIESKEYSFAKSNEDGPYLGYLDDELVRHREAVNRVKADLLDFLPIKSRIFEVGCATGSLLQAVREYGYEVGGIDLSESFVKIARQKYSLPVISGDFLTKKFEEQWDGILAIGTVPTLQNFDMHLKKINQVLRPGGVLFFNFPYCDSTMATLYRQNLWMFSPSVCTFLSRKGCFDLLKSSGFKVLRTRVDYQMPSFMKFWGHSKLSHYFSHPRFLQSRSLPFRIPIPGIQAVWAQKV